MFHLPWGQLVFDYFTALPLDNKGPYGDNPTDRQKPRVDLDGLRVHGRININAAPWSVLSGLPFVPMERVPASFRATFREALGLLPEEDAEAIPMGQERAEAIVAYREQREVYRYEGPQLVSTGDYDGVDENDYNDPGDDQDLSYGRGWDMETPTVRRGMGFLTVGELANIRHPDATDSRFQIDFGEAADPQGSYLRAIAVLASLSDWVTVRSQVFTIYGTIRGEMDDTIEDAKKDAEELALIKAKDVDSRALRFQETVDRLPTVLGAAGPERIGDRVLTNYIDQRND